MYTVLPLKCFLIPKVVNSDSSNYFGLFIVIIAYGYQWYWLPEGINHQLVS